MSFVWPKWSRSARGSSAFERGACCRDGRRARSILEASVRTSLMQVHAMSQLAPLWQERLRSHMEAVYGHAQDRSNAETLLGKAV